MQQINIQKLKTDILGNYKEIFKIEFSMLSAELDTFIKRPGCGGCIRGLFEKMFSDPKFEEKLKLIYGEDIEIDKTIPAEMPNFPQEIVVKDIPVDEWEGWFRENCKITPTRQIRLLTTFFNPIKNVVTVSMVIFSPPNRTPV